MPFHDPRINNAIKTINHDLIYNSFTAFSSKFTPSINSPYFKWNACHYLNFFPLLIFLYSQNGPFWLPKLIWCCLNYRNLSFVVCGRSELSTMGEKEMRSWNSHKNLWVQNRSVKVSWTKYTGVSIEGTSLSALKTTDVLKIWFTLRFHCHKPNFMALESTKFLLYKNRVFQKQERHCTSWLFAWQKLSLNYLN